MGNPDYDGFCCPNCDRCMAGEPFDMSDGTVYVPTWEDMKWGAEKAMPYSHKKMPLAHDHGGPCAQPIQANVVRFTDPDGRNDGVH